MSQRRRITLNIFVETLHSFYKDGLNGTRDYRSASGLLLLATIGLTVYAAHGTGHWTPGMLLTAGCTLLLVAVTVAYVQPFRSFLANLSVSYHTFLSAITCFLLVVWMQSTENSVDVTTMATLFAVLNFTPHFMVALWIALSQIQKVRNVFSRGLTLHTIIRQRYTILSRGLTRLERYNNIS